MSTGEGFNKFPVHRQYLRRREVYPISTARGNETRENLLGSTEDRLLGALAVAASASVWGTLGLFAKILYAQEFPSSRWSLLGPSWDGWP